MGIVAGAKDSHAEQESSERTWKRSYRSPETRSRPWLSSLVNQSGECDRGCKSWNNRQ